MASVAQTRKPSDWGNMVIRELIEMLDTHKSI